LDQRLCSYSDADERLAHLQRLAGVRRVRFPEMTLAAGSRSARVAFRRMWLLVLNGLHTSLTEFSLVTLARFDQF